MAELPIIDETLDPLTKDIFGMNRKEWRICIQDPDEPILPEYYRIVAIDEVEALKVLMSDYYSSLEVFEECHREENINEFNSGSNFFIDGNYCGREISGEHYSYIQKIDPFCGGLTMMQEFKDGIIFTGDPRYDYYAKFGKFKNMKMYPPGDLRDDEV